jgi:two-component system, NarL family, response regulator LiaR
VSPIRVVVVDDHRLFLLAVRSVLEPAEDVEVVGEADSGTKGLSLVASTRPDLVLMDVTMPHPDGLACLDTIVKKHPKVKVAMISESHDADVIESALRRGACAFIQKSINPDDLAAVIRHIVSGTVIQSLGRVPPAESAREDVDLTERELAILRALAHGLSNDAIAKELWIACPTVKFHVRNVYRKLGVGNRTEAASYAYEHGLVTEAPSSPVPVR